MAHKIQIFQQGFQKKIMLQAERGDRVLRCARQLHPTCCQACHICKMFAAIDMSLGGLWPWSWAWGVEENRAKDVAPHLGGVPPPRS